MSVCIKCWTGRSGDKLGDPCKTPGCDGIIVESPRLHDVTEELPEPMTCGRRREDGMAHPDNDRFGIKSGEGLDRWLKHTNGNRVCNYCGSLHPDDFFALVKRAAESDAAASYHEAVGIEPSDKGYKIYVRQPGVRNAIEGGIKFYTQHLPRKADGTLDVTDEQQAEYREAQIRSDKRFNAFLGNMRAGRT